MNSFDLMELAASMPDPATKTPATKPLAAASLPDGAPAWITPELIESTLRVWQPHYAIRLSPADAVTILRSVGRLFEAFGGR